MKESKSYLCYNRLTVMNAARLVRMVNHSDSDVLIGVDGYSCSARNILFVLSLRIEYGDLVSIVADGSDAHEVIENIGGLLCEDGESSGLWMSGSCSPLGHIIGVAVLLCQKRGIRMINELPLPGVFSTETVRHAPAQCALRSQSRGLSRPCPTPSLIHPVESFEDPGQVFLLDARTFVGHTDFDIAAVKRSAYRHVGPFTTVLDRIVNQVPHGLFQQGLRRSARPDRRGIPP